MNSFNPAEAYVSPHMVSFVGLESSSSSSNGSQKHQLWDWETPTTQATNTAAHQAPLFANSPANNSVPFYGCAAPNLSTMGGGSGGGYPFHSDYTAGFIKSEEQRGAGQIIGLNLGGRTYFPSGDTMAVDQLFRRSRGFYQVSQQVPRCQAEGCKADLSGAKHYHRRHKVCELHSKATVVLAGGMQQRFCQQCSRFHLLSEFDEAKRSCRKRLAEHNRRRRKSQPPPTASTTATDRSPPPDTSTTSTEKSQQTSPNSTRTLAHTKDVVTTTAASVTTVSTNSQVHISLEGSKVYQKTATHLRNGPSLSLGGTEGAAKGSCFGFHSQYHQQMPWTVMSDENMISSQQEQQQRISSSSSSSGIFFQHQNFVCSGANDASQPTTGDHQNNLLQLGQGMLEVDFM